MLISWWKMWFFQWKLLIQKERQFGEISIQSIFYEWMNEYL